MKSKLITVIISLMGFAMFAQQGINYKALIKDDLGNVIANQNVTIRFTIFEILAGEVIRYQETKSSIMTDVNGLLITNIGKDQPSFDDLDWWNTFGYNLRVEIDITGGTNFIDMGTTQFNTVPYAIHAETAENVNGLGVIDEGNGAGWRLIGSDAANYGNIGEYAVDLSFSDLSSSDFGATGVNSLATGIGTTASGFSSTAMGNGTSATGSGSTAMGDNTSAMGSTSTAIGRNTEASGINSTALGSNTYASGNNSIAMGSISYASGNNSIAMGHQLYARSGYEIVIGRNNTNYTPNDPLGWDSNDRLFTIGASSSNVTQKDALIVLKNGTITAPSLFNSLINTAGNSALITKRYADENYVINSAGDVSIDGDVSVGGNAEFDGEIQQVTTGNANMIPLAYGTVDSNGNIETGTGNFTAFLSGNVFIIDVNGTESLSYGNTVCLITPISTAARTSSTIIVDGNGDSDADLNVRIFNASGTIVTTTFQFVIYKL